MRIAFLGLGAIGTPMAVHVAKQHQLTVWNRTGTRAAAFAAAHACAVAATPREAAAGAEVVITCLPTSSDVESLLDGPDGLLAGLGQGALFLDCTSGDPDTTRRIGERLAPLGIEFADAPVSGGTNGAEAGTLTVMVGGTEETFRRARPILDCFGRRVEHMGPLGAGHAMKAVNNALLAVNVLAVGEGLAALVKSGISARKAVEVLNASSGRSFVSEYLVPQRVLTRLWPLTFRLALLDKDARIATGVLEGQGVSGPVLHLTSDLLAQARAALGEDADYLEPIRLIEQEAGVELHE
ncbi:MAG TPA: NAD(P)-dependent oxidoreductase [Gemmatimonadales bacterium]|nr:NAD(P)-dependent oxidoreductase [Gemmatimonadales bacterium]HRZ09149.1 NAD(P)-dependent oxidoreductase [Gemmatimonadales bacterium]